MKYIRILFLIIFVLGVNVLLGDTFVKILKINGIKVNAVESSPSPLICGQEFSLLIHCEAEKDISSLRLKLEIVDPEGKLYFYTKNKEIGLTFPITNGSKFDLCYDRLTAVFPGQIPGDYVITCTAESVDSDVIMKVKMKMEVVVPN